MQSKSEKLAAILANAILDHRLLPGHKLGERELSEILDSSRIVIRQALIELAESGLVTIHRNRGAFVAKPSLQEGLEIYDALTMIEQSVAEALTDRMRPAMLEELKRLVAQQRAAAELGDEKIATKLGKDFHRALMRLSHNRIVQEIHDQLLQRASLLSSLFKRSFDACNFAKDHERIIELIESGNTTEVKRLILSHNQMIARSHDMDGETQNPRLPLQEALEPYLQG